MGAIKSERNAHKMLRGSTLIEVMTASVIFLILFAIALTTLSRLTLPQDNSVVLVEVDHRMSECHAQYLSRENGVYTREFEWGEIKIIIKPYKDFNDLREMVITAQVRVSRKKLEVRHIIENKDVTENQGVIENKYVIEN